MTKDTTIRFAIDHLMDANIITAYTGAEIVAIRTRLESLYEQLYMETGKVYARDLAERYADKQRRIEARQARERAKVARRQARAMDKLMRHNRRVAGLA